MLNLALRAVGAGRGSSATCMVDRPNHAPLLGRIALWLRSGTGKNQLGQSVGGDEKSSHCVNIILVKLIGFVLCSLLAGLSGILVALAWRHPQAGDGLDGAAAMAERSPLYLIDVG